MQESEQDAYNRIQTITNQHTGITYTRCVDERLVTAEVWVDLINQAEASLKRPTDTYTRRSVRLLAMIGELHKLGFQQLRVFTYMTSGGNWRCEITIADEVPTGGGSMFINSHPFKAVYSSAMGNKYFGWTDTQNDSARELAAKFVTRFPDLVERGRGHDWPYAGWFQYMLGIAERGYLPVSFGSDFDGDYPDRLCTISPNTGNVTIALPPSTDPITTTDCLPEQT